MRIHVGVDTNILANWILHDAFLQSEKKEVLNTHAEHRFVRGRIAYEIVEFLATREEYGMTFTLLNVAELFHVILRERMIIESYREGIPLREACMTPRRRRDVLTASIREELESFLSEYVERLKRMGARIARFQPSFSLLRYFTIHYGLESSDAFILATLLKDPYLAVFVTQDEEIPRRMKEFVLTKKDEEGRILHEERVRLMTAKQFREEIIGQGKKIEGRKKRVS